MDQQTYISSLFEIGRQRKKRRLNLQNIHYKSRTVLATTVVNNVVNKPSESSIGHNVDLSDEHRITVDVAASDINGSSVSFSNNDDHNVSDQVLCGIDADEIELLDRNDEQSSTTSNGRVFFDERRDGTSSEDNLDLSGML